MQDVLRFLGDYWWLVFVFGGTIGGAAKAVAAANERRVERRQERFRIKQQTKIAVAQARARDETDAETRRRSLERAVAEQDRTDAAWVAYELDPVTLLDFPLMTDMREPLTVEFHKARRRADLLRPEDPLALLADPSAAQEYREAVHTYVAAFDVAEAEAKRRRRGGFSPDEQEHLVRAQSLLRLAMDAGATPQERRNAYQRAQKELDGLIDLPTGTRTRIESRIAGEIESSR